MVDKRTVLDALEFGDDGAVSVRLRKQIVLDGEVLKEEFHRTVIPPGGDASAQMQAVSANLETMGYPSVSQSDIDLIVATASSRQAAAAPS